MENFGRVIQLLAALSSSILIRDDLNTHRP